MIPQLYLICGLTLTEAMRRIINFALEIIEYFRHGVAIPNNGGAGVERIDEGTQTVPYNYVIPLVYMFLHTSMSAART